MILTKATMVIMHKSLSTRPLRDYNCYFLRYFGDTLKDQSTAPPGPDRGKLFNNLFQVLRRCITLLRWGTFTHILHRRLSNRRRNRLAMLSMVLKGTKGYFVHLLNNIS